FYGVLEALGCDQSEARAAPLDQRVGADRGGIDDRVGPAQRVVERVAGLLGGVARGVEEADLEVVVGRVRLAAEDAFVVATDDVGEGAAHVDAEPQTHGASLGCGAASRPCLLRSAAMSI